MAIIDPEGLFSGERLAACSDVAQLYWPRFFLAANSCGRIELSYKSLISRVFVNFHKIPEAAQIWQIFREYDANFLAVLYETEGGTWWCQFVTSEKFLPKYKKTRDNLSPAPSADILEIHRKGYLEWKKSKSFQNQSFQKVSANSSSEGIGIGVGIGEGIGKKQKPSPKAKPPVDARFSEFKDLFFQYYDFKNNVTAPWDGREGKAMQTWLAANPERTLEEWKRILRNRTKSSIGHSKRLSAWIEIANSWLNGLADEWGKPPTNGGKTNGKIDRAIDTAGQLINEIENRPSIDGGELLPGRGAD